MADLDNALGQGAFLDTATALIAAGDYSRAIETAEAALADPATAHDAVFVLAAVAYRWKRLGNAIKLLEGILDETASVSDAPEILAILNCLAGRQGEALYLAKLTTIIKPQKRYFALFGADFPSLSTAFASPPTKPLLKEGREYLAEGLLDKAIDLLEQHLELFPNDVDALDAYADALSQTGRPQDAIGVLRSVLTLGGPSATLYCRLGCCLTDLGAFDQALASHAEALARAPNSVSLLSRIAWDLERHGNTAQALRAEVSAALAQARTAKSPKTVRSAPRAVVRPKICIGYLCGNDLSGEAREMVSRVALAHDRATVTPVAFGMGELTQPSNICYRGAFERWVNVAPLDELTLSVIIRGEGVDVLVDADGLLAHGREVLFARNPAPLQLNWLHQSPAVATPGSHGSLADDEAGIAPLLLWPAAPVAAHPRPDRPISFGADVHLSQLNAETVRVWSAILHAVPNATLSLYDNGLSRPDTVTRLIDMFGNFGVAHRIDIASGRPAADFLAECDIALAPFPAPSPVNYGKALSLGLPVITLAQGQSRLLANTIRHSGFDGARMVADTPAAYVALATAWANDLAGLAQARANAAAIVATSPAFSPSHFAAALEAHVRNLLAQKAAAA